MKIILVAMTMCISFCIGFSYKSKTIQKHDFLVYIKNFTTYLKSNINLFKSNIINVIDDYKKNQDKKNDKFNEIFIKNSSLYEIDKEKIKQMQIEQNDVEIIYNYLKTIGQNDYYFEDDKINKFLIYLDKKIEEYSINIKTKGDLTLKIAIAIGCVISIIIW